MKAMLSLLNKALCGLLILIVRCYKIVLSPLIGPCCRFEPTCSTYCIEALRTHGVFKGLWLTVCRLCRCRPFGPSGYDPVPEKSGSQPPGGGCSGSRQPASLSATPRQGSSRQ